MSHVLISCPGCKSKIRYNKKSARAEIKCARCRKVLTVSPTGSVKLSDKGQANSGSRSGSAPEIKQQRADSKAEIEKRGQTPTETGIPWEPALADNFPTSDEAASEPPVQKTGRTSGEIRLLKEVRAKRQQEISIWARQELHMFLLGLATSLILGYSGLYVYVTWPNSQTADSPAAVETPAAEPDAAWFALGHDVQWDV